MSGPIREYDQPAAFRRVHELGDQLLELDSAGHLRALYSLLGSLASLATRQSPETSDWIVRQVERAVEFANGRSDEPVPQRLERLIAAAAAHAECPGEGADEPGPAGDAG